MKFYCTLINSGPTKSWPTRPFDMALSLEKSGYGPEISLLCVMSIVTASDVKFVVNTTSLSTLFGAKLVIFTALFPCSLQLNSHYSCIQLHNYT